MELILGTAQLNGRYGRFRRQGHMEPYSLLRYAQDLGFSGLDTAADYEGVESIIGKSGWRGAVHTKISAGVDPVKSSQASLGRLRSATLDVLYFHDPGALAAGQAFFRTVRDAMSKDRVKRLGVSIYTPNELEQAISIPDIQAVQFPLNVVDGRFSRELLQSASDRGIALYARSVLLQGALLQSEEALPSYLSALAPIVSKLASLSCATERSVVEIALAWIKSFPSIEGAVVGAEKKDQLEELTSAFRANPLAARELGELSELQLNDDRVLDPRLWES